MASIPMVDHPEEDIFEILSNGDLVEVDADAQIIKLEQ
jgi:predicted aconitase with swiveling domain